MERESEGFEPPQTQSPTCAGTISHNREVFPLVRYCIAHNPLLLQPLGHWFTFIYRKCEHLAVGSSEQGLTRSRGHPHFVVALPSPVVPLLYHNLGDLSRGFLYFFSKTLITSSGALSSRLSLLPLTPIVYHRPHQKSSTFFKNFQLAPANSAPGRMSARGGHSFTT